MSPKIQDVRIYLNQKGLSEKEADNFYFFHQKKNWRTRKGTVIKNWRNQAREWADDMLLQKQKFR